MGGTRVSDPGLMGIYSDLGRGCSVEEEIEQTKRTYIWAKNRSPSPNLVCGQLSLLLHYCQRQSPSFLPSCFQVASATWGPGGRCRTEGQTSLQGTLRVACFRLDSQGIPWPVKVQRRFRRTLSPTPKSALHFFSEEGLWSQRGCPLSSYVNLTQARVI